MRPLRIRTLFLLLFFSSLVAATNFAQCLDDFRNDPNAIGGVDSQGRPTSPAEAVGLTYKTCTARCGGDAERFEWREFAWSLSSWVLPWLILISQLPFGSGNYADDFVSGLPSFPFITDSLSLTRIPTTTVVISLGSPALVAYSLFLTSLTARLVHRRAQRIRHESKNTVGRALIALQQVPLELTRDERLLAFTLVGGQWGQEITDRLNQKKARSVATVAWIVIAFAFTLTTSFISLDNLGDGVAEGHAVGTLWLWLLCLVVGWLWVPTFTSGQLRSVIGHANRKAAKKAAKTIRQNANAAYSSAKNKIANRLPKRLPTLLGPRRPIVNPVPEADDSSESDSSISVPRSSAPPSIAQRSIHPEEDRLFIYKNDPGSLNRDELRLAATFNYSRIMRYLVLVDDVLRALDKLTPGEDGNEVRSSRKHDLGDFLTDSR